MEKTAKKLFRIERLEKRIAPSKLICGVSKGSGKGSHKGSGKGSHKGSGKGSHKGSHKGSGKGCPAPKSQPCS
ncbi:MAG: hypothetical protein U0744_15185 [Gemmataceae bacterium]|jgi:hypothetical protein